MWFKAHEYLQAAIWSQRKHDAATRHLVGWAGRAAAMGVVDAGHGRWGTWILPTAREMQEW